MKDPLEDYEPAPPLKEQVEPFKKFGDAEMAVTLLHFDKQFGGAGISTPAAVGASYYCPECEENVRGVTKSMKYVVRCPLCGHKPGMLTLGSGPK